MVEKALEEALHDKVVCTVAKSRQFPNICLPSEATTAIAIAQGEVDGQWGPPTGSRQSSRRLIQKTTSTATATMAAG